jgi:hypothetical protein
MHHAQTLEGAGASGDASQVTTLQRAGQQKAKVVTIDFEEEEGGGGGGGGGSGGKAAAGVSGAAGAGSSVAAPLPAHAAKGSRLSMVRTDLEDPPSAGTTPSSTASSASAIPSRRTSVLMDEPTALLYRGYKRQFLTPSSISSIPILANLSPQDTSSITSLFQLQMVRWWS